MNVLRAIVLDTWRQSRNQVVFILLLLFMGLIGTCSFALPKKFEEADGTVRVGVAFMDEPVPVWEAAWEQLYFQSKLKNAGQKLDLMNPEAAELDAELQAIADEIQALDVPPDQRAAEALAHEFAGGVFLISMGLFIAACAGYFPNMLEAGAIDIVLARPVQRMQIYLGKIVGGMALYTAAMVAVYLLIFIGLGFSTGVWVTRLFLALPLQLLTALVLYCLLALLGVVSRSATLCIVLGLLFYYLVDTGITFVLSIYQAGVFKQWPVLEKFFSVVYWVFPNFGLLKANAIASVISVPVMDWQPFIVAFGWLFVTLGLGIWRFTRSDF